MQSRAVGAIVAIALVVVAVVLFVVLRDDSADTSTTAATTTTTQAETQPKQKPEGSKETTLVVENGQAVGGVQDLEYTSGQQVQFQVKADAPAEVHVHGYDIMEDVAPGKNAEFYFTADIEGGFEVELEETATQIADLTVEPG